MSKLTIQDALRRVVLEIRRPHNLFIKIERPSHGWSSVNFGDDSGWGDGFLLSYVDGDVFEALLRPFVRLASEPIFVETASFDQEGTHWTLYLARAADDAEVTLALYEGDGLEIWSLETLQVLRIDAAELHAAMALAWERFVAEADIREWLLDAADDPAASGITPFSERKLPRFGA